MLFNLYGFVPDYKSASDGMMIDDEIKSMEESENVYGQSHVKSTDSPIRTGICTEESEHGTEFL